MSSFLKPTKYRMADLPRIRSHFKPGQRVVIREVGVGEDVRGMNHIKRVEKYFTVVKLFPHQVLCMDSNGFYRSFTYFQLEEYRTGGDMSGAAWLGTDD